MARSIALEKSGLFVTAHGLAQPDRRENPADRYALIQINVQRSNNRQQIVAKHVLGA
ncbi:hypothetical protein [Sphingomonas sp.]|uniref:hypothetical protein n=1 Tax=Sphingomonas sp. TaxID=28214 RepID=UPI0025CD9B49|nr:hypothetical protein [Sphingomonas sp.]